MILLPILLLGLVPIANAYSPAYMVGFTFAGLQQVGGQLGMHDVCHGIVKFNATTDMAE